MNQLLHTPEGMRDIYNGECERKLYLEDKLQAILKSYGCRPVQTPSIEFFDIFGKEENHFSSSAIFFFKFNFMISSGFNSNSIRTLAVGTL